MTHITLEQIQAMRAGTIDEAERLELVDHILGCETCAMRFKTMHALDRALEEKPAPRRPRLLPGLAVAAALALGFLIFRTEPNTAPEPSATLAELEQPSLGLLDRVQEVNLRAALDEWGHHTDLRDLISIQNRR